MVKRIKSVLFICIGVLSIILSIISFNAATGGYENEEYYGGDAYTGIQHASAQTANNIRVMSEITKNGFASVLFIAGSTLIVIGIPIDEITRKEDTVYIEKYNYSDLPEL